MSTHKDLVEAYVEGFRHGDDEAILACLTDDVTWYLAGHTTLTGKAAFAAEVHNPTFEGDPELRIDRLVEEGEVIVAIGEGSARIAGGRPFGFAYNTVFVFRDDLVERVESYVVQLVPQP
jgi:ketosteroid isomerase-like protein